MWEIIKCLSFFVLILFISACSSQKVSPAFSKEVIYEPSNAPPPEDVLQEVSFFGLGGDSNEYKTCNEAYEQCLRSGQDLTLPFGRPIGSNICGLTRPKVELIAPNGTVFPQVSKSSGLPDDNLREIYVSSGNEEKYECPNVWSFLEYDDYDNFYNFLLEHGPGEYSIRVTLEDSIEFYKVFYKITEPYLLCNPDGKDRLLVGLLPGEKVRVLHYQPKDAFSQTLVDWAEYQADGEGNLYIHIPNFESTSGDFHGFIIQGKNSGVFRCNGPAQDGS